MRGPLFANEPAPEPGAAFPPAAREGAMGALVVIVASEPRESDDDAVDGDGEVAGFKPHTSLETIETTYSHVRGSETSNKNRPSPSSGLQ